MANLNRRWNCCLLLLLLFISSTTVSAQPTQHSDPCALLLQQGLYNYFKIQNTGDFKQTLKTYFASDEFRNDYSSKKWSGTLNTYIDGNPLDLAANSDQAKVSQFQQSIRQSTNFDVATSFYSLATTAIPNVELAKEYRLCLEDKDKAGFKVHPQINENSVAFVISYKKDVSLDPMPKVVFFELRNGTNIRNAPIIGETINDNIVITADRNPEKDMVLILQTDRKVATYTIEAESTGFNRDLPIGTIVASVLDFNSFSQITENKSSSEWTSRNKWAPSDGRSVVGSKYATKAQKLIVPDLRGVFLRGLNQFDPFSTNTLPSDKADPDTRSAGDYQADAFKAHSHSSNIHGTRGFAIGGNPNGVSRETSLGNIETSKNGSTETRPKNISVYYYIRIN